MVAFTQSVCEKLEDIPNRPDVNRDKGAEATGPKRPLFDPPAADGTETTSHTRYQKGMNYAARTDRKAA